ncbi:hypothetical protein EUZ85_08000 [Hahella sp. KA22]|uniref:DUF6572 domain-containing protein n=1 Tax=Hahella sp. KA22 TaxID=1628392 RepID=UPI000FDE163B|nr:DUF6572 domain-containing protein [Hahella sp. KA22]AZZ90663.1 hypothetical protein ENC22_05450 [Hahella sp. KA22]QAY54033.1 hypothetical protein EUZ85_08000 [Hahella sp. KA22]
MSIEDQSSVDVIGVNESGVVVLTISDHLKWDDEHLYLLQEKINTYLAFIESGEVYEIYPDSKGKELKINVVCKYEPSLTALKFLSQCATVINQAGFQFGHEVYI